MDKRFEIDRLISNCNFIKNFCSIGTDKLDRLMIENCDRLIETSKQLDKIALNYCFQNIPTNGFILFFKIVTVFTDRIVNQIEKDNKIKLDFVDLFKLVDSYRELIWLIYENLKNEEKTDDEQIKFKTLFMNKCLLGTKSIYDVIHTNGDVKPVSLGRYPGFWLPKEIRRLLKLFNFCFAIAYKLPISLASLYSSKSMGKYCYRAFKNATLNYPFSLWHRPEGFFMAIVLNSLVNIRIPVKSVTLEIPRQYRYRIHYKGDLIDFNSMSNDEIESYFDDQIEQSRQNHKGLRHRNGSHIWCRYSYITSKEKIIKSLKEIKKTKKEDFKKMTYHSATRLSTIRSNDENERNIFANGQVEQLKIYETNDLVKKKLKLKGKRKKLPKYDGPNYDDFDDLSKDAKNSKFKNSNHYHSNLNKINDESIDFNSDRTLLIYLHGGGFVTQGPRSCELFLRKIINQLGGIPSLGIHYSLTVPHPISQNEILDVYLWALSGGEDVKKSLGFHPKKIVLFGDSAGSFFAMNLCVVLNELNRKFKLKIPLPSSLVLCYPIFGITLMTPSRSLSLLEPLIAFSPLMLVVSLFGASISTNGEFKKLEKKGYKSRNDESTSESFRSKDDEMSKSIKRSWKKNSAPWYLCDFALYKERSAYINQFYKNAIFTPILYDHFDDLKDVDLYTVVGELDFLVDDSIEISQKWKGNVSLDIVNDLMHGYFYFSDFSVVCEEASNLSIQRLQKACGLN